MRCCNVLYLYFRGCVYIRNVLHVSVCVEVVLLLKYCLRILLTNDCVVHTWRSPVADPLVESNGAKITSVYTRKLRLFVHFWCFCWWVVEQIVRTMNTVVVRAYILYWRRTWVPADARRGRLDSSGKWRAGCRYFLVPARRVQDRTQLCAVLR